MKVNELLSPSLLVYPKLIEQNLDAMILVAGSAQRLRPHCKTHKMREVVAMQLARGITKHKCATLMEAEMLAECGVKDILLAYNVVGPNIARVVRLLERWPDVKFACTGDYLPAVQALGAAVQRGAGFQPARGESTPSTAGRKPTPLVEVLLDVDVGMHRTGMTSGPQAVELYRSFAKTPGIKPGGLHAYDGHNHQHELADRRTAAREVWRIASELRDELEKNDLPVPRIVCGGTPTFSMFAEIEDPAIELSPGTIVLHDTGYGGNFPDLPFVPAAKLLTRVISRPAPDRITLDLGHKAVAADPPAGRRVFFPDLPDAKAVLHNEEHLVLETPLAARYQPGDALLAIPTHICPTCALHKEVYAVEGDEVVGTWKVASRDRV
jgi:D-serine deaminase-like pyridoxal phosphate-dependent protein